MKKLFLLFAFTTINILTSQEPLAFEKVIPAEGLSQDVIYNTVKEWFIDTYDATEDRFQIEDREAGLLMGKGYMDYVYRDQLAYLCYNRAIMYNLKVYIKDGRYKVLITNFDHKGLPRDTKACVLGTITTDSLYATKGLSKKYHNRVWADIKVKVEDYSNGIFSSVESATKNIQEAYKDGDW